MSSGASFFVRLFWVLGFFLAMPRSMWDTSYPNRDQTRAPCIGSAVLTTGPPGKSLGHLKVGHEWDPSVMVFKLQGKVYQGPGGHCHRH